MQEKYDVEKEEIRYSSKKKENISKKQVNLICFKDIIKKFILWVEECGGMWYIYLT